METQAVNEGDLPIVFVVISVTSATAERIFGSKASLSSPVDPTTVVYGME